MQMSRPLVLLGLATAGAAALAFTTLRAAPADTATPAELVASYDSLANAILAVKTTEDHLVRAILANGYAQAQAAAERAKAALDAGDAAKARPELETLAALVAQLGTEGDNAVAGVRKRLLEGGHHHNAEGEQQGIYDEGYVVVTKAAKKTLLDASKAIAAAKDSKALSAAWAPVESTMPGLIKG
jgi:hypothetical protein